MKKTEQENEELKQKLKTLEESSVSENWWKFRCSYKLFPWGPVQSTVGTRWFDFGYFKFPVILSSKSFPLNLPFRRSFTPRSFTPFRAIFRLPSQWQTTGFNHFSVELNWKLSLSVNVLLSEYWGAGKWEWLSKTTSGDAGRWTSGTSHFFDIVMKFHVRNKKRYLLVKLPSSSL